MEKLVYLISKDRGASDEVLRDDLIKRAVPVLRAAGAQNVSLNVDDAAVDRIFSSLHSIRSNPFPRKKLVKK